MTDPTKRLIIAAVVAVLLIAGSVAAIAVIDDDEDEGVGPLVALAEKIEERLEDRLEDGDLIEELLDRVLGEGEGPSGELLDEFLRRFGEGGEGSLPDRFFEFFGDMRDDPEPAQPHSESEPDRPRRGQRPFRDRDRAPFEGFGFRFDPGDEPFAFPFGGEGFFGGELFDPFLEDGVITPEEAGELRNLLREMFGDGFGFGFGPGNPFLFPAVPFGDRDVPGFVAPFGGLPLDEFLADGRISPDEARELERLFRESVPGGVFRFEFVPPVTDRARVVPDVFLEGLTMIPFREFLADGELSPEERELLREAVNEWLDELFARVEARSG